MIHVLASIRVKPGKRDILIEHINSNIPHVIKEKGCIEYNSTIDVDYHIDNQTYDEHMVTIIEKWENFDTLKKHMHAPHMLSYRENVKDLVENTSLQILTNT
jgi:quinol monooxygenase YgiN